jgi:hypothetical protein
VLLYLALKKLFCINQSSKTHRFKQPPNASINTIGFYLTSLAKQVRVFKVHGFGVRVTLKTGVAKYT